MTVDELCKILPYETVIKVFAKYLKDLNISDKVVERQSIEMWG